MRFRRRGSDVTPTADAFRVRSSLPQVHFHLTTAQTILRHNGVKIGTADYMGG